MDASTKQHDISEYATKLIRRTAKKLVGKAGLTTSDIEDLESELTLHLLEHLPKFDAETAAYSTFVTCVVKRKAAKILRDRTCEMRDPRREACSLNEDIEAETGQRTERAETISREEHDRRLGGRSEDQKRDMTLDVEEMLSRLPDNVRKLCELAKTETVAEAARRLGIPESTAYSQLKKLRTAFRDAGLEDYLHIAS